jgi:hypothetical protein
VPNGAYRGTVAHVISGLDCLPWAAIDPAIFDASLYPDLGLDSNYCRAPDHDTPWCFVENQGIIEIQYCDVCGKRGGYLF